MVIAHTLEEAMHPLGLVGIILFFVFGVLAKKRDLPHWWPTVSMVLAFVALIGTFTTTYINDHIKDFSSGPTILVMVLIIVTTGFLIPIFLNNNTRNIEDEELESVLSSNILSGESVCANKETCVNENLHSLYIIENCRKIEKRILNEINSLDKKGIVNLTIGVVIALIGIWILASTIFDTKNITIYNYNVEIAKNSINAEGKQEYFILAQRVTLSLFIEIFAFFFLRLYGNCISDRKYFQNELTNLQSKFIALNVALGDKDKSAIRKLIDVFSNTERNFLLKKGQTTVDLEKSKLDVEENSKLSKIIEKLIGDKNISKG